MPLSVSDVSVYTTVPGIFTKVRAGGTVSWVVGYSAFAGVTMAVFDLCGGSLDGRGLRTKSEDDKYDQKKYHKENRRRPVQENVDEMIAHNSRSIPYPAL